jgi:CBS-domain-containing membrane protein
LKNKGKLKGSVMLIRECIKKDVLAIRTTASVRETLKQLITHHIGLLLMRPATVVGEDSGLLRAYAIMQKHDLHDLPIVDQSGRIIGIASRVDIATQILSDWQ